MDSYTLHWVTVGESIHSEHKFTFNNSVSLNYFSEDSGFNFYSTTQQFFESKLNNVTYWEKVNYKIGTT